jgi:hypothetical protein
MKTFFYALGLCRPLLFQREGYARTTELRPSVRSGFPLDCQSQNVTIVSLGIRRLVS